MSSVAPAITTLTGPPYLGIVFNWGLFGALSIQVYLYFQVFPKDRTLLKAMVYTIYSLEVVQTLLITNTGWKWLVSGFGMLSSLETIDTESWVSICVIGGLASNLIKTACQKVAFLVQLFYVYRIKTFSNNVYMSFGVIILSVFSYAGSLGTSICAAQLHARGVPFNHNHEAKLNLMIAIWLVTGSSCDILIALTMCYYLRKGVQGTPFQSTRHLVSRLVRMTLETGTLTASLSIVSVILFFVPALMLDWQVPIAVMAKLYSTTLLAVLNSRMDLLFASKHTVSWN